MVRDKLQGLRMARMSLVVSMFSVVLFCFAWVLQAWEYPQYAALLPLFLAAAAVFLVLFLKFAPLCNDCRQKPWSIFGRHLSCCFSEKVSLRKVVTRTSKIVAVVLMVGGALTMYIRPIYAFGTGATAYLEQKMRRPALEKFQTEEAALLAKLKADPKDRAAAVDLAWLYYRANKVQLSAPLYARLLAENPDDPETLLLHAVLLADRRESVQEEEVYEKILTAQPENADALLNFGLFYLRGGVPERAIEKLVRATEVLERQVSAIKKRLDRTAENPNPEDQADLKAIQYHQGMVYFSLAIAYKLKKDTRLYGRAYDRAAAAGISMVNIGSDVARYGGR